MSRADRSLARRMLSGDERAFDEFFESHFGRLYRFALRRLNQDEGAAEEIAQATLCKAITKLSTYRGEAALFTWLCTFCRHEISAWFRRNRVAAAKVDLIEEVPEVRAALESMGTEIPGPDSALRMKELASMVQITLDGLPGRYGDALEWKYLENLSVKEIASRLDLSPKAAESLLTRARDSFRDAFSTMTGASVSLVSEPRRQESH